jgi:hypothetical protein
VWRLVVHVVKDNIMRASELDSAYQSPAWTGVFLMREDAEKPELRMLPVYTDVKLARSYERDGLSLPAGAKGTIVDVYPQFGSYSVDFDEPFSCLETLSMTFVVPL